MKKIIMSAKGSIHSLAQAVDLAVEREADEIYIESGIYENQFADLSVIKNSIKITGNKLCPPILSGSKTVTGFKKDEETGFFYVKLSDDIGTDFRMLSCNGAYMKKARFPQHGTFKYESSWEVSWKSTFGNGWERKPTEEELTVFTYRKSDIPDNLCSENAEIVIYHEWDESFVGVKSIDTKNCKFILKNPCFYPPGAFGHHDYVIYNTIEGMQEPGNWYIDRPSRILYIYPTEDMDVTTLSAVVPTQKSVIKVDNTKNVTITDICFSGCCTPLINPCFGGEALPGVIDGNNVQNILIKDTQIKLCGGNGIRLTGEQIKVSNCKIEQIAGSAIWVGINDEYLYTPYNQQEQNCSSCVENCSVKDIGLDYESAIGIFARHADVISNIITNTPYSGINAGGDFARVEGNIITNAMSVLNDGAAIYTIGYKNGIIKDNIIRKITKSFRSDSKKSAIYLDEKSSNWIVEDNTVIDCDYPFFCHMNGTGNAFKRNIVSCNDSIETVNLYCLRCEPITFESNIFMVKGTVYFLLPKDKENILKCNTFIGTDKVKRWNYNDYQAMDNVNMEFDSSNQIINYDNLLKG